MAIDISIIIINWNGHEVIKECLSSLMRHERINQEIWVVDNASTDDSLQIINTLFPDIKLITNSENIGFGKANNQAAKKAQGEYLLLLNPDTIVKERTIERLVDYLVRHSSVAAVGPRMLNADSSVQVSAFPKPTLGRELWRLFHLDRLMSFSQYPETCFTGKKSKSVDVLLGACILIRADIFKQVGCFDEDYFVYTEEVDLCERIRSAGWQIDWMPDAEVIHLGGMSTRQVPEAMFLELYRNKIKFFRKHRGNFQTESYKIVLAVASYVRIFLSEVISLLSSTNKSRWKSITENYRTLLAALPGL
jgi:GT2 family glycosyltransferase